jgi:hypothetical protein
MQLTTFAMPRRKWTFTTAFAILLALPVRAQSESYDWESGNSLYELCLTEPPVKCAGYIEGIVDANNLVTASLRKSPMLCIPKGVTLRQLVDVVLQYLRDNPSDRHYAAAGEVVLALGGGFPCAK